MEAVLYETQGQLKSLTRYAIFAWLNGGHCIMKRHLRQKQALHVLEATVARPGFGFLSNCNREV
jgi:hypothetical protein